MSSVHDELVKLQSKLKEASWQDDICVAPDTDELADDLAPIIASAREQEQELAALKTREFFPQGFPPTWLAAVERMKEQHDADLREVAEMAAEKWAESEEIGFEPSEEQKKWFVDSILREFREQKAKVQSASKVQK